MSQGSPEGWGTMMRIALTGYFCARAAEDAQPQATRSRTRRKIQVMAFLPLLRGGQSTPEEECHAEHDLVRFCGLCLRVHRSARAILAVQAGAHSRSRRRR